MASHQKLSFGLLLLVGLVSSLLGKQPNLLLIMADDMGYSDLGCYGSGIDTPHIDQLASKGLRFSQFHNTGRCCPSRASLLTGLYSHQAGVGHMMGKSGFPEYDDQLRFDAVTLPEVLRSTGYRTYMSGKWHLGWSDEGSPNARGFDRFYGHRGYVDSYFTIVPRTDIYIDNKIVLPAGKAPINQLHPEKEFYTTDAYTDYAIHFLNEHDQEKPFFLYMAYNAPHFPLHALPEDTAKYRGRFREKGWDPQRENRYNKLVHAGLIGKDTALSLRDSPDWSSLSDEVKDELDHKFALYCGIIDRLDQNVGRLVAHLEKSGQLENTVILFLSDNGSTKETGMFGIGGHDVNPDNYDEWGRKGGWTSSLGQGWANVANTPFRRYKRENHEGGTSSPLIIWSGRKSGLGIIPGSLTHQVAHIIDILPTLADLGGALVPNHLHGVKQKTKEGRSLVPHLKGASPTPRTLYWEHEGHRAVRSGDMKLVALSGQPWELYDLSKDRSETVDLAGRQPQTVKRLESTWNAWATRVGVRPWNEVAEAMKTMRRKARGKK